VVTKLLRTKLFIPLPKHRLVSRQRLLEQINQSTIDKLTLISAPPGFGKTTLLSEWISLNPDKSRIAWLSLDKGDNDPVMFWAYVITSLQSIEPDMGAEILQALLAPQIPAIQPLLNDLINEITNTSENIYLVLDDYHLITSKQVNEGMQSLIDNQPQNLHLILSTRADPPWSLAHLRARAEVNELRAQDLRFNFPEVVEFLNDRMG